ncbi:putative delta-1-pyrroline-5-carboxylate dehydrogenase [Bienertia sinuspersici]
MGSTRMMKESEKRVSTRKLGKFLREQRGRFYIIRRCIVMLICSQD